jgi:hypothetical protein
MKLLVRLLSVAFVSACIGFVIVLVWRDWPAASQALRDANYLLLIPAAAMAALSMGLMAWRWGAAIDAVGGTSNSHHRVISSYFVGEFGKYIPGGVFSMLGRGEMARREGHPRSVAYSSIALSLIALYLAAALTSVALAGLALLGGSITIPWWPLIIIASGGIALLHPRVGNLMAAASSRVLKRPLTITIPSFGRALRLTAWYVPAWILVAGATVLVARSLDPHVDVARVALAAVLGWVIGFVTPSPGGIGVREAIFVAVAGLSAGPATAIALLARLLFVGVDAIGAGLGWFVLRGKDPRQSLRDANDEGVGV